MCCFMPLNPAVLKLLVTQTKLCMMRQNDGLPGKIVKSSHTDVPLLVQPGWNIMHSGQQLLPKSKPRNMVCIFFQTDL